MKTGEDGISSASTVYNSMHCTVHRSSIRVGGLIRRHLDTMIGKVHDKRGLCAETNVLYSSLRRRVGATTDTTPERNLVVYKPL